MFLFWYASNSVVNVAVNNNMLMSQSRHVGLADLWLDGQTALTHIAELKAPAENTPSLFSAKSSLLTYDLKFI